jgi:hypothetical protein
MFFENEREKWYRVVWGMRLGGCAIVPNWETIL